MNNYPHLPAVTSCPLSTQTHCNSWSCWPAPGGGEVKMGYVMLTGDDGAPKVLPSLCLHCQNGQLVCGYSWLSGSLPFCGGGLMFFPWLLPLEGWHSTATSAQPMLQLTQGEGRGGGGGCGLFYLISVSTRASVWCKRVGVFSPHSPPYLSSLLDVCGSLVLPLSPYASPRLSTLCKSLHTKPFILNGQTTAYWILMWFIRFPVSQHRGTNWSCRNQWSHRCAAAPGISTISFISLKSEWSQQCILWTPTQMIS